MKVKHRAGEKRVSAWQVERRDTVIVIIVDVFVCGFQKYLEAQVWCKEGLP